MKEQEEIIELHLMNKDIWKEFIKEPRQNKSVCYLQHIEIKVYDVQAKSYFFIAKGEYELFDRTVTFQLKAKAILLKNDTVKSVHKVKEEKINLSLIKDTMKTKLQFQAKVLAIFGSCTMECACKPFTKCTICRIKRKYGFVPRCKW
jgi:hypothetical protein